MASSCSWSRVARLRVVLAGLAAACALFVGEPARAQNMGGNQFLALDARRALPLFPGNSWRDGFYIEHSGIGDFGLHLRVHGSYGRDPLGIGQDPSLAKIDNRVLLQPAVLVAIATWVELGLALPAVVYQDSTGLDLSSQALGDLRLLGKVNLHLPDKGPQIALSVGLGFETASKNSAIGAGAISGYPRLIIDMPKLLSKRLHIAVNFGAVLAGTTRPCTPEEQAMEEVPGMEVNCEKRVLGLGNHILFGAGVSGAVSPDTGLFVTTELLGSVSFLQDAPTQVPLFWTIGIRRAKSNATYFSAAYGKGLTAGSPEHMAIFSLGYVWENRPPPPKKESTLNINLNITGTGLPAGSTVQVSGKDTGQVKVLGKGEGKPGEGKPGEGKPGEGKPGEGKPAGEGGAPPKPAKPTPVKTEASAQIDVPEGLVPAEAKGGGGGGKK
jgi:uncharacterized low-complexity protein